MVLAEITTWCCSILQEACSLSVNKGYLTALYKTACFFKNAFCGTPSSTNSDIVTQNTSRPNSQVTHYLEHVFGNISSLSQNITRKVANLCIGEDTEALEDISIESTTSLQMVAKEEYCFLNWCEIYDHVNFWWRELYKKWWHMVTFRNNQNLHFPLVINFQCQEVDCITFSDLQYLLLGCIIGVFTVILCFRIRNTKPQFAEEINQSKPIGFDKVGAKKLIERVEASANNCKKATEKGEATFHRLSMEVQKKIDTFLDLNQNVKKQQRHVRDLENKCRQYQHQVDNLSKELTNERKLFETEIKRQHSNDNKIKKLQNDLDDTKGQLKLSRDLHENELKRLHQEAVKFRAEKDCEVNKLRQNIEYIHKQLTETEKTVAQQENVIKNLKQEKERGDYAKGETTIATVSVQQNPYISESLKKIEEILANTKELGCKIEGFKGNEADKSYLHLKEMLIRNALKLDNIESEGHAIIRKSRKDVLEVVHRHLKRLENRAKE